MRRTRHVVALAVALTAPVFDAKAQDGDVAAGHALAREACKACHMVEPEVGSPRRFLSSSHSKMPNLILSPEEIADVSAYILSLRDHP